MCSFPRLQETGNMHVACGTCPAQHQFAPPKFRFSQVPSRSRAFPHRPSPTNGCPGSLTSRYPRSGVTLTECCEPPPGKSPSRCGLAILFAALGIYPPCIDESSTARPIKLPRLTLITKNSRVVVFDYT